MKDLIQEASLTKAMSRCRSKHLKPMQIVYSKGSGTDRNVERTETLEVNNWCVGTEEWGGRNDLVSAFNGCLQSILMKLTCSGLKDSKKLVMNGGRY